MSDTASLTVEDLSMVNEPPPASEPAPEPAKAAPEPVRTDSPNVEAPKVEPPEAGAAEAPKAEAPADPAKPAGKPTTLLAEPGTEEAVKDPVWPDDWRARLAGDDAKLLKRLERFGSPKAILDSYLNMEKTAKQAPKDLGEFPAEGTDAEKAEWRKAAGVPDSAQDYLKDFSLSDGLVIGENDKPVIDEFLSAMHGDNVPANHVQRAVNAYYQMRDKQINERIAADDNDRNAARDMLKDEYGNELQRNLTAAYSVIPEDIRDDLLEARLPNGTKFGNHPQILNWLTRTALEINPAATVAPGSNVNSLKTVEGRIAEIEGYMRTDRDKYQSQPVQDEYLQLLSLKDQLTRKQDAA